MSDSEDNASDYSAAASDVASDEQKEKEQEDWVRFFRNPAKAVREIPTVIYVHGIAGSQYKTWGIRKNADLPDLVKLYLEDHTDPAHYGYTDITVFEWDVKGLFQGPDSPQATLEKAALHLLQIARPPNQQFYSPLVIIAHDIGGVVAKKALLLAREYTYYRPVMVDVDRVVFMGTPHTNDRAIWRELLVDFSVALRDLQTESLLTTQSPERIATELASITNQFRGSAKNYRVMSVYQTEPPAGGEIHRIIVPRKLALVGVVGELTLARCRSHFSLAQFTFEDDQLKAVAEFVLAAIWDVKPFDDYRGEYFATLSSITPETGSAALFAGTRSSNTTFDWIFKDDTYQSWHDSSDPSILHIQGSQGSGKTSLLQFLAQHYRTTDEPNGAVIAAFFFDSDDYASSNVDNLCRSLTGQILSTQTVIFRRAYEFHYQFLQEKYTAAGRQQRPYIYDPSSWYLLRSILSCTLQEQIICVIDGIDECRDSISQLLRELVSLVGLVTSPLKIILSSSDGASDLQEILSGCITLSLEERELMQSDAKRGIESAVDQLVFVRPALRSFKAEILTSLCQSQPLNILDAGLKVKCLESVEMQSTSQSVTAALKEACARTPHVALEASLCINDDNLRRWALRVMSWMVYAFRPLRVGELATALAMVNWHESPDLDDGQFARDLESDLKSMLGAVVLVEEKIVKFTHPSVREVVKQYVRREQDLSKPDTVCHRTIFRTCLAYLTRERINNISDIVRDMTYEPMTDLADVPDQAREYGLALYAINYWHLHFQDREIVLDEDVKYVKRYLTETSTWNNPRVFNPGLQGLNYLNGYPASIMAGHLGLIDVVKSELEDSKDRWVDNSDVVETFVEAARCDYVPILEHLKPFATKQLGKVQRALIFALERKSHGAISFLKKVLESSLGPSEGLGALLVAAASAGHTDLVERILNSEANKQVSWEDRLKAIRAAASTNHGTMLEGLLDPNTPCDSGEESIDWVATRGLALHDAVLNGHHGLVTVLAQDSTSEMHEDELGRSPLHIACLLGFRSIVAELVNSRTVTLKDKTGRTALHYAAAYGAVRVVQTLLDAGADINATDANSETPLILSITYHQVAMARLLLSQGANSRWINRVKESLLHIAISTARLELVELVVSSGTDLEVLDETEETPLMHSITLQMGYPDIALYLIDHGANVEAKNQDGATPLINAAIKRMPLVVEKLLSKGANPGATNRYGATALHLAAYHGSTAALEVLLKHEHDIEGRDLSKRTPLHEAARNGNRECAEILLKHGAATNVADSLSNKPITYAANGKQYEVGLVMLRERPEDTFDDTSLQALLHNAAMCGDLEAVKLFLSRSRNVYEVINSKDDNDADSVIYNAVFGGSLEVVELVFAKGAELKETLKDKRGPLHRATSDCRIDLVQYLLDKGADVNQISDYDGSALHIAIMNRSIDLLKLLLKHNARTEFLDLDLTTPLQRAISDVEMTRLLLDAGADVRANHGYTNVLNTVLVYYDDETSPEVLKMLLDHGANVADADKRGMTATHWAAHLGRINLLEECLNRDPQALQRKDKQGRTALHFAAANDCSAAVTFLLDKLEIKDLKEADVADDDGWTPLHWSCKDERTLTWPILLDRGADPSRPTKMGWNAKDIAVYHGSIRGFNWAIDDAEDRRRPRSRSHSHSPFRSDTVSSGKSMSPVQGKPDKNPIEKDEDEQVHHILEIDGKKSLEDESDVVETDHYNDATFAGIDVDSNVDQPQTTGAKEVVNDQEEAGTTLRSSNSTSHGEQLRIDTDRLGSPIAEESKVASGDSELELDRGNKGNGHGRRSRSTSRSSIRTRSRSVTPEPIDKKTGLPVTVGRYSSRVCNHCMITIQGPEFTCLKCRAYYLCFKCSWHSDEQHPFEGHPFTVELAKGEIVPGRDGKLFVGTKPVDDDSFGKHATKKDELVELELARDASVPDQPGTEKNAATEPEEKEELDQDSQKTILPKSLTDMVSSNTAEEEEIEETAAVPRDDEEEYHASDSDEVVEDED